jgi:hypothetical protein
MTIELTNWNTHWQEHTDPPGLDCTICGHRVYKLSLDELIQAMQHHRQHCPAHLVTSAHHR